jgi:hypothetical protein
MAAATPSPMSSSQMVKLIPRGLDTMKNAKTLVMTVQASAAYHQRLCPETPTISVIDTAAWSLEEMRAGARDHQTHPKINLRNDCRARPGAGAWPPRTTRSSGGQGELHDHGSRRVGPDRQAVGRTETRDTDQTPDCGHELCRCGNFVGDPDYRSVS